MKNLTRFVSGNLPPVAVIADAHYHDIESDYGWDGLDVAGKQLNLRSWIDTRSSSRVFNESKAALEFALNDIHKKGIKHVVLLGDYSDDGQIEATRQVISLLRKYKEQYEIQFFAITGNHDAFGPVGKHQSTRFASGKGETVLVTSDPKVADTEPDSAVLTHGMYCQGVPAGIAGMSEFGLFRQSHYVHWESPFGISDSLDTRQYDARSADGLTTHKLVDASYLVEPVDGLWLLMIDANVFEPRNGQWKPSQKRAFLDSSDAGWNAVLRHKSHLVDWISDICVCADQAEKTLIAFSHYPIIDPFADWQDNTFKLFGYNEMRRRKPEEAVSRKLLDAGLRLHFSGHLHVSALSEKLIDSKIVEDCAVPSLVAFPACYKIIHPATADLSIDTVQLSSMQLDSRLMEYYRDENIHSDHIDAAVLRASNYGEFLYQRMHTRVVHHYLVKEWPEDISAFLLNTTTADLALFMLSTTETVAGLSEIPGTEAADAERIHELELAVSRYGLPISALTECSMTRLVSDWYCLRHAACLARTFIAPDNLVIYQYLTDAFADLKPVEQNTPKEFFTLFLCMLRSAMNRSHPSATREQILSV